MFDYFSDDDSYDTELLDLKVARLYIDETKQKLADFKDLKMFGTLLNICGYDLTVGNYEFINACAVEYHVNMLNGKIIKIGLLSAL